VNSVTSAPAYGSVWMTEPPADKETALVDVSGIPIDDLLRSSESALLESLRRVEEERDNEAVAGFSQGLT
jgi:FXSXX-COOH protein